MSASPSEREIVQGLEKGLEMLVLLNRLPPSTVAEIARAADLPRTTTLRMLGTLAANGYLERSPIDRRYRLTIKVRTLAHGFDEESWLTDIAAGELRALTREFAWPVLIAIPSGPWMILRENTDHATTLTLRRHSAGVRTSILGSASGRVYLAYCGEQERAAVIRLVEGIEVQHRELLPPAAMASLVARVRDDGYALTHRPGEYYLSVPVLDEGRYLASLSMRVMASAMSASEVAQRFTGRLARSAAAIATRRAAEMPEELR